MILNKQDKDYKKYISLQKRRDELWKRIQELPLIPLKIPIQRGWDIYLDFRDDVKNRKDYTTLRIVLNLVKRNGYTRKVKDIKRIRENRSLSSFPVTNHIHDKDYLKYKYLPNIVPLKENNYEDLSINMKKWFILHRDNKRIYYKLNIPRYWIVIKSKPHIVKYERKKGGPLEKEYNLILDKLQLYRIKYGDTLSGSYPRYKDRSKIRDKISKFKKGEIDDIFTEKIPKEYKY